MAAVGHRGAGAAARSRRGWEEQRVVAAAEPRRAGLGGPQPASALSDLAQMERGALQAAPPGQAEVPEAPAAGHQGCAAARRLCGRPRPCRFTSRSTSSSSSSVRPKGPTASKSSMGTASLDPRGAQRLVSGSDEPPRVSRKVRLTARVRRRRNCEGLGSRAPTAIFPCLVRLARVVRQGDRGKGNCIAPGERVEPA